MTRGIQTSVIALLAIGAVGYALLLPSAPEAQGVAPAAAVQVETGTISPGFPSEATAPAVRLSPAEMQDVLARRDALRESTAAQWAKSSPDSAGLPATAGHETHISTADGAEFPGTPSLLTIGRNNRNTNANNPAKGSTLAEPSAVNSGVLAFAAGNFNHTEISSNGGVTWTDVPQPAGPTEAPILCCDHDVIMDDASRVVFHSTLYINSAQTNGVVRINVRRNINMPGAPNCFYTIDPGGTANNVVPDYPHLGLTKRFVYLSVNAIGGTTNFARMYRLNLENMANCVTAAVTTFTQPFTTFGQRVWVPAEGTNNIETMFWGQLDNPSTFRIFSWSEAAGGPTQTTRPITATVFPSVAPDCRGGTNNQSWFGVPGTTTRTTPFTIAGFRLRGAAAPGANGGSGVVAFYWNAGRDSVHTQQHIHAAVFSMSGLALLAQPHIFSQAECFGYPVVTANKRGDLGLTVAYGGRLGGGGTALRAGVSIDDEFTAGLGVFPTVTTTAAGTHMPADARFGDYFTIRPYEPCEKWFTATNYAFNGGTALANINSRFVEFGRQQSFRCYNSHRGHIPVQ